MIMANIAMFIVSSCCTVIIQGALESPTKAWLLMLKPRHGDYGNAPFLIYYLSVSPQEGRLG